MKTLPARCFRCSRHKSAFALVGALVIVSVMAVVMLAFLGSLASERATSHALAHATRAELAAQSGVDLGIATLKAAFEDHPDSATAWETLRDSSGGPLTGATVLYFRTGDAAAPLWLLPLVSGAGAEPLAQRGDALHLVDPDAPYADPGNTVDLNRARYPGDVAGWIGSPPGGRQPIRVPWVEMTDPGTSPGQAHPARRVLARFAFWVEDESFKLDVNRLSANAEAEADPGVLPLQGLLWMLGDGTQTSAELDTAANALAQLRAEYPGGRFPDLSALCEPGAPFSGSGDALRFAATLQSATLDLSRDGMKRVNLNALVEPSADPTEVRAQLDALLAPIRHSLPRFGQRFYRTDPADLNAMQVSQTDPGNPGGGMAHEEIYLQKIAANLRDALTPGSQPTLIAAGGSVLLGSRPTSGIAPDATLIYQEFHGGPNPVVAIGKENVPYLQEFAARVTLKRFTPNGGSAPEAEFAFDFDFYFEFWNMMAKDLRVAEGDLGPHPFLRIYDLPGFDTGAGGTPLPEGGAMEIALPPETVFPAGKVTVLTTDSAPPAALLGDAARVVILPDHPARHYAGVTRLKTSAKKFRVNLIPRHTAATDYGTKMLLGNDLGILESFCALPLVRGNSTGNNALSLQNDDEGGPNDTISGPLHDLFFIRGGSLRGTGDAPLTGDPRTNNEQLFLRLFDEAGDAEQTRYYHSGLDNPGASGDVHVPAESTLGLPNANYVDFTLWPDPFPASAARVDTPMFVANGPMRSIGELGHLFDPARRPGPSGDILYSRGGGRTLAVGQPDPLWDGDPFSASREWAAWRLTDLFTTRDTPGAGARLEGRINLNGALRDGGAGLRAALYGLRFSSGDDADPALAGLPLSETALDTLVARLCDRLAQSGTRGPLAERGELSELLAFPAGEGVTPLYDRGREELFRRLVEEVCTRGSVFSVYAVGQSLEQTPTGKKIVTATSRRKITFELIPVWDPPLPESLDPAQPEARLRPPDYFRARVLRATP